MWEGEKGIVVVTAGTVKEIVEGTYQSRSKGLGRICRREMRRMRRKMNKTKKMRKNEYEQNKYSC